ncbi:MAG: hypothetical protein Q9216_004646 [Gyalolechia sp. 2 TL-2023]
MHHDDGFVDARDRRSPPRKQLAYRDSIDSFDDVMIVRRDDAREVYLPKNSPYHDDWQRRRRSRSRSSRSPRRHHHRKYYDDSDGDSDTDSILSSDEERERSKVRNKTLLAACLATVTTVAAGNNIYQSAKAHQERKNQLEDGKMSRHEERDMKKKGVKLDLMSLGVAAVCLNNAKNGWKRLESQRAEARKVERKQEKERRHRD